MKILFLSRPITNGGDFLFSERAKELLCANLPQAEVTVHHLLDEMDAAYINTFDKVVIAGGPLYDNRFLTRESIPFFAFLAEIKPPIHFLSNGWYGSNINNIYIYIYNFYDSVIADLKYIEEHGGSFSCRDYITETVLRNNGLKNIHMVGCAAWYDMEKLENQKLRNLDFSKVRKIAISDQGMTKNSKWHEVKFKQTKKLVEFVQTRFPKVEIVFTFNGGIDTKYSGNFNRRICEFLSEQNISFCDLSGSMNGFHVYDDIDLHIGYRVHSHIYCLSQRIPTVLIEEDARGGGVNQALGLPDIQNYSTNDGEQFIENPYLFKELEVYLQELQREDCSRLQQAVNRMEDIYQRVVVPYIKNVIGEVR
ncbi:Polysaccharide pyruvyl transferase [Selenomonas sp. GACV-9]|uniref:polysaccharide pyruvyl transferase family protein n=1 Tax=Selenomonas sp. GACV-9 TaxID=3158782 RepID=UPI0008F05024|nr:Polysaccharide pyruvyl transferase [Selenomonas ruminantium]